jgi:hypothetical protein
MLDLKLRLTSKGFILRQYRDSGGINIKYKMSNLDINFPSVK